MSEINLLQPMHASTRRNYVQRVVEHDKAESATVARQWGQDYWDGDRRYGYGGYRYDGRWRPLAQTLIDRYGIKPGMSVLDVGCGKGFLLYEMQKILPGLKVVGFDISKHGLENAHEQVKPYLFNYRAQDIYPYGDDSFDLVISLGTLHNLRLYELEAALKEVERVGKNKYVMVEGYRNVAELHNLECWALTAESILHTSEWIWLYGKLGYTGDYEFIYFE